jgi:selenocysteine lyase/cysteine desulfurase
LPPSVSVVCGATSRSRRVARSTTADGSESSAPLANSTVRPSLAFYNTRDEIDRLADAVARIARR